MLNLTLANCPVSWGIEEFDDPRNTPWDIVLDQMAGAGYRSVELGPPGYFPSDAAQLREALERRGLTLASGYLMGHFGAEGIDAVPAEEVHGVCELLAQLGAPTLILMEAMSAERDATSGRSEDAPRLPEAGWERLLSATHAIAAVAKNDFGLEVAYHPHVATYVEFDDEIDRYFRDADPTLVGLCLDTGHSVWAEVDLIDVLARHGERLRYLHLKDVDGSLLADARSAGTSFEVAVDRGVFCPVGSGLVDFLAFRDRLIELAFDGGAAVEQDRTPGRIAGAVEDAEASMRFLREYDYTPYGTR
jgi:inosose dehydratase